MRVAILVNRGAGSATRESVAEAVGVLRDYRVEVDVRPTEGRDLTSAARLSASWADVVVAAGGDGTVAAVAGALVSGRVPLGILPLGTLNHFARDLGLPLDVADAATCIVDGVLAHVDVARVGDRVAVNDVAVGVYPLAVMARERLVDEGRLSKWPAMALAVGRTVRRLPVFDLEVGVGAQTLRLRTPAVLVGVSPYDLAHLPPGHRPALDAGRLGIYVLDATRRRHLVVVALRGVVGRVEGARRVDVHTATEVRIASPGHGHLPVAVDGEPLRLASPLRIVLLERALPVIARRRVAP